MTHIASTEAIWAAWIVGLIVTFGALEGTMIHLNRPTLSWTVWSWSKAWPPLPFIAGLIAGGLAVHFFWIPVTAKGF